MELPSHLARSIEIKDKKERAKQFKKKSYLPLLDHVLIIRDMVNAKNKNGKGKEMMIPDSILQEASRLLRTDGYVVAVSKKVKEEGEIKVGDTVALNVPMGWVPPLVRVNGVIYEQYDQSMILGILTDDEVDGILSLEDAQDKDIPEQSEITADRAEGFRNKGGSSELDDIEGEVNETPQMPISGE
jgi:co-chaperonin GroES (HSP10)